jgi:hypothetical protein
MSTVTLYELSHLLARHNFEAREIWGDTILRLADDHTFLFAAAEEHRYKKAVRRLCESIEAKSGDIYHPRIDVIARKTN